MDDLARKIADARDDVQPRWDDARAERVYAGIDQLRRRRAVTQAGTGLALAAAAALAFVALDRAPAAETAEAPIPAPTVAPAVEAPSMPEAVDPEPTHRLADGSTATLVDGEGQLALLEDTAERIELDLTAGRARFDVVKNSDREFVVHAGAYRVSVLGTVFEVARSGDAVEVTVLDGRVRVEGGAEAVELVAGTSRRFEPVEAAPDEGATPKPRARQKAAGWRSLVKDDDYHAAFAALEGGAPVENTAAALMDAADAARLSGHPAQATGYLDRVVSDHGKSPMAPLAAFTLGRVYLDQLGQPHRAARAFERARLLSPSGQMAQDALAREVEALSKAGDARKAYLRAQEYVKAYPNGRRIRAVRLHGGL